MNLTISLNPWRLPSRVLVVIAGLALFSFASCAGPAGGNAAGSPSQLQTPLADAAQAQNVITQVDNGLRYSIGPAVTGWLLLAPSDTQRTKDAAIVNNAAKALKSAAAGQALTPDQIKSAIAQFSKSTDPRYGALAALLTDEYANVYPLFPIAGSSPAKFLTDVATYAQTAVQPFLGQG